MRFVRLAYACVATACLLALPVAAHAAFTFPAPEPYRPLTKASVEVVEEDCGREFDVRFSARVTRNGGEGRLCLNRQDNGDGYELVLNGSDAKLVRVESGLQFPVVELGSAPLNGRATPFLVKRRDHLLTLLRDGQIIARAYDGSFAHGAVAYANAGVELSEVEVQPTEAPFFTDDFMKPAGEMGEWEALAGKWEINSLENPVLSSNAFSMLGTATGEPALCAAGYWFWDSYECAVSVEASGEGAVGIAFAIRDANNYYALRWEPMPDSGARGKRQLLRVRDGVRTVLDEASGGYLPHQWFRLDAAVRDGFVEASIDGNPVLRAADAGLSHGRVALYTESPATTFFDDVEVKGFHAFADDFGAPSTGAWQWVGGNWTAGSDDDNGRLRVNSPDLGLAVCTAHECRNFEASAEVTLSDAKSVGLCFHYQDPLNYYALIIDTTGPSLTLRRTLDGKTTNLRSVALLHLPEHPVELRLRCEEGHVAADYDGLDLLQAWDNGLTEGRVGLLAQAAKATSFDNFRLSLIDRETQQPVYTVHEVFSKEKSMEDWAAAQSDWLTATEASEEGDLPPGPRWHRADFYGDTEIAVMLGDLSTADAKVSLFAAADDMDPASGYTFVVKKGDGLEARLLRCSEVVARKKLTGDGPPAEMSLARRGRSLVGLVDGEPIVSLDDDRPLQGVQFGYEATGTDVAPENVKVYADNVYVYTFQKATSDWRTAAGIWEVTNRWECDPRWSFFSGRQDDGLAVIWNKRNFRGDVTLEFCGATKMNRSKEQRAWHYDYADDINATLCADGDDLTSGYSFMFGGWGNKFTRLVKGKEFLAESTEDIIPSQKTNIHHMWFYLKIQKRGNRLRYWIDNKLVFDTTDPEPLSGGRIALWTESNGVMVARVRISAQDGGRCELPDRPPQTEVKSIYDQP